MADGDYNMKVLFRTTIPGGGFNTTGVPKQHKTLLVAELSGTYNTGGIVLNPGIGLDSVDFVKADVVSIDGTDPADGEPMTANFLRASNKLLIFEAADGGTETDDSDAFVIRILAIGDSGTVPELL